LIHKAAIALVILAVFGAAAGFFSNRVPRASCRMKTKAISSSTFSCLMPPHSGRTDEVTKRIEKILAETPGVKYTTSVVGFSLLSFVRTSYNAFFFVL